MFGSRLVKFGRKAFQIGERVHEMLLAEGVYIPQQTQTQPDGTVVVTQDEVVRPQGALRSTTIQFAIAGITGSWVLIQQQLTNGVELEIFLPAVGTLLTSIGTIWRHIRSWMPVRGMATPTTRVPPPISQ